MCKFYSSRINRYIINKKYVELADCPFNIQRVWAVTSVFSLTTETLVVVAMELNPLEFLDLLPDDGTVHFFLPHLLECSQRHLMM